MIGKAIALAVSLFAAAGLIFAGEAAWSKTADDPLVAPLLQADDGAARLTPQRNRAPRVRQPIANRQAREDVEFRFRIPARTFVDPDGDRLRITVPRRPNWLRFNQNTRTLFGTPRAYDLPGPVTVRATDPHGARVAATFRVQVFPRTLADDAPPGQSTNSPNLDGSGDSRAPSISADGRFVAHVLNQRLTDFGGKRGRRPGGK